jgi:hypothetical protein
VEVAAGGVGLAGDVGALLAASGEQVGRAHHEQHRQRPEQERGADDGADRDVLGLLPAAADQGDDRDDRLREGGADGREQRADGARAQVHPLPEPLDGVREADRPADDQHEGGEQLERGHGGSCSPRTG